MRERIIESLHHETAGWINSMQGPIKEISKNGEMALVPWYVQTITSDKGVILENEYNGKYVTQINWIK